MNEISQLLNKISLTDNPKDLLNDLKLSLKELNANRLKNVSVIRELHILFDSTNSSDK